VCGSPEAFGLPGWGEHIAPGPVEEPGGSRSAGASPCAWDDLVDWLSRLADTKAECLPSALWLISRSRACPWELLGPAASDRKASVRFPRLLQPFKTALSARRAQDPEDFDRNTPTWRELADWVRRPNADGPEEFWLHVCAFFISAEVMGRLLVSGQPSEAELEALLDHLDRHQTYLLPAVLEIMASIPEARIAAARWKLLETTPQQRIRRQLAAFDLAVLRLINSRAPDDVRLTAELCERFRALPPALREAVPDCTSVDLPLDRWLEIGEVLADRRLSIPRKAVEIHQLRLGMTPADLAAGPNR